MLERIVEYLNAQLETRQMVVGAMVYPGIIFVMAIGTTIFLLLFVVPQFVQIFKGKEAILPVPTKILLFLSGFMAATGICCWRARSAASWGFCTMIHTQWGRLWWDKTKLTVPLFKKMFRALYITR